MRRRQPISTRTNTLLPSRTLFRSKQEQVGEHRTSQPPCPAVSRSGTQSPGNLARRLSTRGTGAQTPSRRPRHEDRTSTRLNSSHECAYRLTYSPLRQTHNTKKHNSRKQSTYNNTIPSPTTNN